IRTDEFKETSKRSLLYTAFVYDLRFGTYQDGHEAHGLHWSPTTLINIKRLTRSVLVFSDWLCERYGSTLLNAIHHQGSFSDLLLF
ncbi:hypothetical protein QN391_25785, partial [Pseudomonas sp. CCI1.2]|uniref:hypothetical protein n=1 Tax=Pseudomonas sp. CCI1.2 TaxID=3048614 RepID=UPI002B22E656